MVRLWNTLEALGLHQLVSEDEGRFLTQRAISLFFFLRQTENINFFLGKIDFFLSRPLTSVLRGELKGKHLILY